MVLTGLEILEMAVMVIGLAYIFSGFIQRPRDPFEFKKRFDWKDLWFSAIVAAPAVVFHELGHKFVAMALGYSATFHVYWFGLALGIVLKLISSPLLIIAPAFVSIPAGVPAFQGAVIAFAGPFVNLVLFGVSTLVLKYKKKMSRKEAVGWAISKKLNIFLFFFNMIPLPPLDGYHVLNGIF
jgi:Zn-dependent protease